MAFAKAREAASDKPSRAISSPLLDWIDAFFGDKSLPHETSIVGWRRWALEKLGEGWTDRSVREWVADNWGRYASLGETEPLPEALKRALFEGMTAVAEGATPAQVAVLYRSLAAEFPTLDWLRRFADEWAALGDSWLGPNPPRHGNLGRLLAGSNAAQIGESQAEIDARAERYRIEAERQLASARNAGLFDA